MKKGLIIGIIIFIFIVGLVFFFSQKKCDEIDDCFLKCEKHKEPFTGVEDAIVDLQHPISTTWIILGEKQDGKCKVSLTIDNVTNPDENWAVGTTATCFLNKADLDEKNPLNVLRDSCQGSFADGVLEHCYSIGASHKCDGPLLEDDDEKYIRNKTLDKDNLCEQLNDDLHDIKICAETLEDFYKAFNTNNCNSVKYASDKDECEEAIEEYNSYEEWYETQN